MDRACPASSSMRGARFQCRKWKNAARRYLGHKEKHFSNTILLIRSIPRVFQKICVCSSTSSTFEKSKNVSLLSEKSIESYRHKSSHDGAGYIEKCPDDNGRSSKENIYWCNVRPVFRLQTSSVVVEHLDNVRTT